MAALLDEFLEVLGLQVASALEGMLGEQWKATVSGPGAPTGETAYFGWRQKLNLHAEPVMELVGGSASWSEVGKRALRAAGLNEPEAKDIRATFLELMMQSLSGLARDWGERTGTKMELASGAEIAAASFSDPPRHRVLRFRDPQGFSAELFVLVSSTLLDALQPGGPGSAPEQARHGETAVPDGAGKMSSRMEMLLDVELPVSVSFGRAQLALRDLVKLTTGSIVELNRTIAEPVEVIVNNCVVARGEVVVVEGNYGVRIQQILSRADRLRSMD